ncbi:MAG: hypothetical protein HWN80_07750 [Candidatus Lokiarchaeota archaeon]|nr:hypothetical protein [Candidatus Lokiarchaeota archaeon]
MTKSNRFKIISIILSLIGGYLGFILGFGMLTSCNLGWIGNDTSVCVYFSYIGGIGLLVLVGALIELISLIAGSIICLISGVLGIIFVMMITMFLTNPTILLFIFFLIIAGGALGLWDFLQQP